MAGRSNAARARRINAAADFNTAMKIAQVARSGDIRMLTKIGEKSLRSRRENIGKIISEFCDEEGDGPLHYAARLGQTEICEYLIKNFMLDANLTAYSGKTPLCYAANFGDPNAIESLINCGADFNVKDANGFSPLHDAVIGDNPRAIEVLLSKGAKVDVQNFTGSPLLLATLLGHISCMKVLLAHNADPNELLCGVVTPLLIAMMNNEKCTFHPPNQTKEIVELLIKVGADVNKIPVLSLAYHSKELMEYLLESGADPNLPDEWIKYLDRVSLFKLVNGVNLLRSASQLSTNFQHVLQSGRLPIEVATMRGKIEFVEILFPVTPPIAMVPNWSIKGLLSHVTSEKIEKECKVLSKNRLVDLKQKIKDMLFQKEFLAALVLCNYVSNYSDLLLEN
ncbi:uncharacterized protein LOC144544033 [Carex rostrata]